MKELMLADLPVEERKDVLRDSCDQIEEKHYTRKFSQNEKNEKREELADLSIQLAELNNQLREIRAEFKAKMKPVDEELKNVLSEIKAGGKFIKGECYKFIDNEEGKVGYYTPEGYLIEMRDMRPEEKQRTMFQVMKRSGTEG